MWPESINQFAATSKLPPKQVGFFREKKNNLQTWKDIGVYRIRTKRWSYFINL